MIDQKSCWKFNGKAILNMFRVGVGVEDTYL